MRVLHVLRPDARTRFGGDVVHLESLVSALRAAGTDAVVSTWADAPEEVDVVHLWNIEVPFDLRRQTKAARQRWPGAPIVLTPIFWPWDARALARSRDPAIWYRAARNEAKLRLTWRAVRNVLQQVDAVLACSEVEIAHIERYYRLRRGPHWSVAPTAVDVAAWPRRTADVDRTPLAAELGLASGSPRIVACAARLEPLKNQRALVKAVSMLDDVALLLVGADQDRRYARRVLRLAERRLPGRFAWLGRQPHEEVRRLLAQVDVHALASHREVASISALEAGAAGCEIVVGRWSSAGEYFGELANVCDTSSVQSLTAALVAALERPRQPALRELIEQRHDWSTPARAAAECYARVLERR